jgi:hypothetical protein
MGWDVHQRGHLRQPRKGIVYVVYRKVPGLGQKKKCWLKLLNFGCNLLQNSLIGNVHSDPIVVTTPRKHRESHFP